MQKVNNFYNGVFLQQYNHSIHTANTTTDFSEKNVIQWPAMSTDSNPLVDNDWDRLDVRIIKRSVALQTL